MTGRGHAADRLSLTDGPLTVAVAEPDGRQADRDEPVVQPVPVAGEPEAGDRAVGVVRDAQRLPQVREVHGQVADRGERQPGRPLDDGGVALPDRGDQPTAVAPQAAQQPVARAVGQPTDVGCRPLLPPLGQFRFAPGVHRAVGRRRRGRHPRRRRPGGRGGRPRSTPDTPGRHRPSPTRPRPRAGSRARRGPPRTPRRRASGCGAPA